MASSVTIDPTLGNPVLAFQGGAFDINGGGAGGDAIDLRRMVQGSSCPQEGILDAAAWKVTATNGDMTVDVAADVGIAVVQGDDVTEQGRYTVAPHSAAVTLDITEADSSAPRLDQIVLHVRDDAHDGSGSSDARVMVLDGTPTAGADLDNRTGHATLPDTCLLLADVLVSNGATEVTTSDVRDRRRWARGAFYRYVRDTAAADYTLSSTSSFADIDTTNLKPRIECTGKPIEVQMCCDIINGNTSPTTTFGLSIDGATELERAIQHGTEAVPRVVTWHVTPAAGSHEFAVRAKVTAANTTILPERGFSLTVSEIPTASGSNG